MTFQLTRLMRGVTTTGNVLTAPPTFQLTRLMRGVTAIACFSVVLFSRFQLTRLMRGVTVNIFP